MVRYRFGDFEFDPRSGQLTRCEVEETAPTRLSPQPARLFVLLLERHPEIVTRAEIQRHLWPDVEVEFEQSLHHCIRQIRTALDDSATEPRYIQTIHRRGYQFIEAVEASAAGEGDRDSHALPPERRATHPSEPLASSQWRYVVPGLAGVIVLVLGWLLLAPPSWLMARPVRLAVMTFQPPGEKARGGPVAEQLVARLTNHPDLATEVIGPTTTASFEAGLQPLNALIVAYNLDYILNGRFSGEESDTRFLAEVIRARDGAHVWVQYFDLSAPDTVVAAAIAEAFIAYYQGRE